MSMSVVLVKLAPVLHSRIVASQGALLTQLLSRSASETAFDREGDAYSWIDYRDIAASAEDPDDAVFDLFQGEPLLAGFEWTYGPPMWFDPAATRALHARLREDADYWPFSELVEFLERAEREGKGVVVGVG
jgi:hypothetical protein